MLRASAKVNLVLEVLGKRPDGYHELSTVMQAVDLFDRLTVETAGSITLETSEPGLPTDDRNLVVRAARLLREAAGVDAGARIVLDKRIPVAAGLGGGSSDAAATLVGLNRLWGLRWRRERLVELGVKLGMDVPFFLGRGRALGTSRGEVLSSLPGVGGYAMVLVNPGVGLSTNHLERWVEPVLPVIGRMKAALLAAGALGAAMSGSGPTVFGLARSADQARQIQRRVTRGGWSAWAVRTNSGAAIRMV